MLIYNIIQELQNTPKLNDKKEILNKYRDDSWFKYLTYVYNEKDFTYGKSKLPTYIVTPDAYNVEYDYDKDLEMMYSLLDQMKAGELKGKACNETLSDFMITCSPQVVVLFGYVLKRDIRAKVGARMLNEVYDKLIHIAPYMRCEKEAMLEKRIKFPCFGQTKEDGLFQNAANYPEQLLFTTRSGQEVPMFEEFNLIHKLFEPNFVLHGELLVKDGFDSIMPRKQGNGRINSYCQQETTIKTLQLKIQNAKSEKSKASAQKKLDEFYKEIDYTSKNIIYSVWDIVDLNEWENLYSDEPYIKRFEKLKKIVQIFNQHTTGNCEMRIVETEVLNSIDEVMVFHNDKISRGLEGCVAKNFDLPWEHDQTTKGMIKLKDFNECDLIIVGFNYGKPNTSIEKGVGSIICESSDGLLNVSISGLSMSQRGFERVDPNDSSKGIRLKDGFDPNDYIGKIVAVKYSEVSNNKKNDNYSLYIPSVLEIREDKTTADDLQTILQ